MGILEGIQGGKIPLFGLTLEQTKKGKPVYVASFFLL